MRAVLDPGAVIAGLLAADGASAELLRALERGELEAVVSPLLLEELERTLAHPKLVARISTADADALAAWLARSATTVRDPADPPPARSADPGDDYLIALAASERAALVSDDEHLLALAGELPVFSPEGFLTFLSGAARSGARAGPAPA